MKKICVLAVFSFFACFCFGMKSLHVIIKGTELTRAIGDLQKETDPKRLKMRISFLQLVLFDEVVDVKKPRVTRNLYTKKEIEIAPITLLQSAVIMLGFKKYQGQQENSTALVSDEDFYRLCGLLWAMLHNKLSELRVMESGGANKELIAYGKEYEREKKQVKRSYC